MCVDCEAEIEIKKVDGSNVHKNKLVLIQLCDITERKVYLLHVKHIEYFQSNILGPAMWELLTPMVLVPNLSLNNE